MRDEPSPNTSPSRLGFPEDRVESWAELRPKLEGAAWALTGAARRREAPNGSRNW